MVPDAPGRLDSWKEIADYLGKGVSTVRRWEREEGLPVRRQEHLKRGSVVAFKSEIDAWLAARTTPLESEVEREQDADSDSQPETEPDRPRLVRRSPLWAWLLGVAVAVVALRVAFRDPWSRVEAERWTLTADPGRESQPSQSPGGARLVYVKEPGNIVMMKHAGGDTAWEIYSERKRPACCAALAPDGKWVAVSRFREDQSWEVILVDTADRSYQVAGPGGPELAWRPDSSAFLYSLRAAGQSSSAFYEYVLATRKTRQVTFPPTDWWGDIAIAVSPDNRRLAYTRYPSIGKGDVYVSTYGERAAQRLTRLESWMLGVAWLPDGHTVIYGGSTKGASGVVRVDADAPPGEPVVIPETEGRALDPKATLRPDGAWRILYSRERWNTELVVHDLRTGARRAAAASTESDEMPDLAPDGRLVFASDRTGRMNLWVCEAHCETPRQITFLKEAPVEMAPRWSPDGAQIVFGARHQGKPSIWLTGGKGEGTRLLSSGFTEAAPVWSADGLTIYFASNRSGRSEVWSIPASGGTPRQVSHGGAVSVHASADGLNLYLLRQSDRSQLVRLTLKDGTETVVPGVPALRQFDWQLQGDSLVFWETATTAESRQLRSMNLKTGESKILAAATEPRPMGLSVNASHAVWTQQATMEADIQAVDLRFRPWWRFWN